MYALGLCGTQRLLRLYRTVSRHARSARVLAPLTHTLNEYTATTAVCVPCRSLGYYTHTDCTACARGRANTIPSSHLSPSFTHIMLDARTLRRTKHHSRSICVVLRVLTYGSSSSYIYIPTALLALTVHNNRSQRTEAQITYIPWVWWCWTVRYRHKSETINRSSWCWTYALRLLCCADKDIRSQYF